MENINKENLVEKLTNIADGFRTSRSLTERLSLDDMAELAAVPIGSGDNKLAQLVDGTLTEITAEDLEGATVIADRTFYTHPTLISITIPNSVTQIGEYAFYSCANLEYATIPNSVTYIKKQAFYSCQKLKEIVIPNGVTKIGDTAFSSCKGVISITLPATITQLDNQVFRNCTNLRNVILTEGLTSLGIWTFGECPNLTNITIPSSISKIEARVFYNGSETNKATFTFLRTTPPTIASYTFYAGYLEKIIVPAGCGDVYKAATNWANLADYIEEAAE